MNTNSNILINKLNMQKQNLSSFIYPDFPDSKVYSKEYYRNIFLNYFDSTDRLFSLMYADFNKLEKINNSFGNVVGDKALAIGHKLLKESFASNALLSRVGGDETVVILPDSEKKDALQDINSFNQKLSQLDKTLKAIEVQLHKTSETDNLSYLNASVIDIDKIKLLFGDEAFQNTLKKLQDIILATLPQKTIVNKMDSHNFNIIIPKLINEEDLNRYNEIINAKLIEFLSPLSISITSSVLDSKTDNVRELEKMTEKHVSEQKNIRDLNEFDKENLSHWEVLSCYISNAIENYLSNIRPSDKFIYDIQDYKKEMFFMLNTFINTLEHDTFYKHNDNSSSLESDEDSFEEDNYISADSDLTYLVHRFLTDDDFSIENLDDETLTKMYDFMNSLMYTLTKNKDNNLFNKSYLKQYLANQICKNNSNYQAVFISMSGIKPSNTAYGHHATDDRIMKTNKLITDLLSDKNFSNNLFTFSGDDSFLIDYGGGNFLLLLSHDQEITQDELNEKIKKINSYYDPQDPNSSFKIAGSIQNVIDNSSRENFINDIRKLKEKCNDKKDPIKKSSFDDITQQIAFEKSIKKCIKYYLENIPDAKTDMDAKRKFISMVFNKLAEQEGNYNIRSRKNIKDNNIEQ